MIGQLGESILAMLVGPNWAPAAWVVTGILIHAGIMGLFCFYVHKKEEYRHFLAFLFYVGGIRYIMIDAKYFDPYTEFAAISIVLHGIGVLLLLFGGAVGFGPDDDDNGKEENPDPTPDPGNKKVVDDFLKSCRKKFLAGLK